MNLKVSQILLLLSAILLISSATELADQTDMTTTTRIVQEIVELSKFADQIVWVSETILSNVLALKFILFLIVFPFWLLLWKKYEAINYF